MRRISMTIMIGLFVVLAVPLYSAEATPQPQE